MIEMMELSITIVSAFLAMCMFSTLYGKGNPFYSLAENTYVGLATGLSTVVAFKFIYQTGVLGIIEGDWILIAGIILGLMTFSRVIPKYSHISRLPIAIAIGAQLGLQLRSTIFTGFIRHIDATVMNLFPGDPTLMLYRWTILLCQVPIMTFFLYTIELTGTLNVSSRIGEYCLYVGLGSLFATTYMGRMAMFVGFMQSLTTPIWKATILIPVMAFVLISIVILDRMDLLDRWIPE